MVIWGLGLVMLTEPALRAVTHNPDIITPHSWWNMTGYVVAAFFCILLHICLTVRGRKKGVLASNSRHTFMALPVWCWSIGYIILGIFRVMSPK